MILYVISGILGLYMLALSFINCSYYYNAMYETTHDPTKVEGISYAAALAMFILNLIFIMICFASLFFIVKFAIDDIEKPKEPEKGVVSKFITDFVNKGELENLGMLAASGNNNAIRRLYDMLSEYKNIKSINTIKDILESAKAQLVSENKDTTFINSAIEKADTFISELQTKENNQENDDQESDKEDKDIISANLDRIINNINTEIISLDNALKKYTDNKIQQNKDDLLNAIQNAVIKTRNITAEIDTLFKNHVESKNLAMQSLSLLKANYANAYNIHTP